MHSAAESSRWWAHGDPLERLALVIELFRAELDAALDRSDRAKAAGRRALRC